MFNNLELINIYFNKFNVENINYLIKLKSFLNINSNKNKNNEIKLNHDCFNLNLND